MSVQSEITRLNTAKSNIATAITNKGVTVPFGTTLDGMATLIDGIEAGGDTVVITTANEDGTQNIYIIDDGSIKAGGGVSIEATANDGGSQTLDISGAVVDLTYLTH